MTNEVTPQPENNKPGWLARNSDAIYNGVVLTCFVATTVAAAAVAVVYVKAVNRT